MKKYIKNLFRSQVLSVLKSIAGCESVLHFLFKKNLSKIKLFSLGLIYRKHKKRRYLHILFLF